jgi:hypothetical protein
MELPAGLVLVVVIVAAGVRSPRYAPRPELRWARGTVGGLVAVPAGMLLGSLTATWYVREDPTGGESVTDGGDATTVVVVAGGLVVAALIVRGLHGRRNWAPTALLVAWLPVGWAWIAATDAYDILQEMPVKAEVEAGLVLATAGMGVMTAVALLAVAVRTWETWPPTPPADVLGDIWRTLNST